MIFTTADEAEDTELADLRDREREAAQAVQDARRRLRELSGTARDAKREDDMDALRQAFSEAEEVEAELEDAENELEAAREALHDHLATTALPDVEAALGSAEADVRSLLGELGEAVADRLPDVLDAFDRLADAKQDAQTLENELPHNHDARAEARAKRQNLGKDAGPEALLGLMVLRTVQEVRLEDTPLAEVFEDRGVPVRAGSLMNVRNPLPRTVAEDARDGNLSI